MSRFDVPFVSLPDYLALNGKWLGKRTGVRAGGREVTWAALDARVERAARALRSDGLAPGDAVAVLMANRMEFVEVIFGVLRAGGTIVPLSGLAAPDTLARMMDDSGARHLISDASMLPLLRDHADAAGLSRVLVGGSSQGWLEYEAFLASADMASPPLEPIPPNARFNIIYSSGTTGVPKGIVHTHAAREQLLHAFIRQMKLDTATVSIVTTPLYTNGSWCVLLPTVCIGGRCIVMEKFDAGTFLELCVAERPTFVFLVPTQYRMILEHASFSPEKVASIRSLMCAGSPLSPTLRREIASAFAGTLIEIYGTTEGVGTSLPVDAPPDKFDSVGLPQHGDDIRIIDEAGVELAAGEIGEIVGFGPGMLSHYHNQPERTADAIWRDECGRSYFRTGDMGCLDADGYLHLLDRKKDMIISGGFNIYAADLEEVLARHPAVAEAAVIGQPHAKWGETPLGLVLPRSGQRLNEEELCRWANEQLGKHQRLSSVRLVQEFPRNALGKVLKKDLRAAFSEPVGDVHAG